MSIDSIDTVTPTITLDQSRFRYPRRHLVRGKKENYARCVSLLITVRDRFLRFADRPVQPLLCNENMLLVSRTPLPPPYLEYCTIAKPGLRAVHASLWQGSTIRTPAHTCGPVQGVKWCLVG